MRHSCRNRPTSKRLNFIPLINLQMTSHFHVQAAKKQKIKFYTTYKFISDKPLSCPSSKKAKDQILFYL